MIITNTASANSLPYAYVNIFPDQFKTEKEKQDTGWIKNTMDYFANVAYSQYKKNKDTFVKNYDLLKGIIDTSHFYKEADSQTRDFIDNMLSSKDDLPNYVKHYPIINPPVNTMIGELAKRPDIHKVRAFDDDSKSEELSYRTELINKYILQEAQNLILNKLAIKGQDVSQYSQEDLDKLTFEEVKDSLTSYTSIAERWANKMLECLKVELNTKEQSEDAFRDLLISSREYLHVIEDNSKRGFTGEVENPKNVWRLGTPDSKYMSRASGHYNVPYAAGTVRVMEISEIIDKFPELTTDEVEHLRKVHQDYGLVNARLSNSFDQQAGQDSIKYDTYNRLIMEERMIIESEMKENRDELNDWMGLSSSLSAFGYKYTVVQAYWWSKKKMYRVTYKTESGDIEEIPVDESYVKGSPNEISVEEFWVNQLYKGIRIGPDIFHVSPFELLPYIPILGTIDGIKNTLPKSLVDMMKPFQVLYNICMNQLYELLEKEIGNVGSVSIRRVPRPKEGNSEDAIDMWELEARKRGIIFDDDSPENTKAPVSNQTVAKNVDLTRTSEIQSRYNLAITLKNECWELVGMNRQRLGAPLATETATANQNALVQSFAQTEPFFTSHQYVMNQYYQALLDAAQYIESKNPTSTLAYVTSMGDDAFIHVTAEDISLRDLKVFVTSRPEDTQLLERFRELAQSLVQNGASIYDVSVLYSTNSLRHMQKVFKDAADKQQQMVEQEQQLKQQELEQQQQQYQAMLEQQERHHNDDMQLEKYKADLKANTDITKQEIATYFQAPSTDSDGDGTPDMMELANHNLKIQEILEKRDLENQKLSLQMQEFIEQKKQNVINNDIAKKKLENDKEKIKIAKRKPKTTK